MHRGGFDIPINPPDPVEYCDATLQIIEMKTQTASKAVMIYDGLRSDTS